MQNVKWEKYELNIGKLSPLYGIARSLWVERPVLETGSITNLFNHKLLFSFWGDCLAWIRHSDSNLRFQGFESLSLHDFLLAF